MVKTDSSRVSIPELDFEIPAGSQKGVLTTVEGILDRAVQGLEQDQVVRRALDPTLADQIDQFVGKLKSVSANLLVNLGDQHMRLTVFETILLSTFNNCLDLALVSRKT